ncbi:hypothetical protein ACFQYP_19105 [Nonomuraea antimicrobica]
MAGPQDPPQRPTQPHWARRLAECAILADAELATQGSVPVTVVHGDPDSDEDMQLIGEVLPALAEQAGPLAFRQGGNGSITYVFAPPDAAAAAAAFEAQVRAIAPPWWRIVPSPHARWTRGRRSDRQAEPARGRGDAAAPWDEAPSGGQQTRLSPAQQALERDLHTYAALLTPPGRRYGTLYALVLDLGNWHTRHRCPPNFRAARGPSAPVTTTPPRRPTPYPACATSKASPTQGSPIRCRSTTPGASTGTTSSMLRHGTPTTTAPISASP